ncbi:hypothetical protein FRC17_000157 [Serendipita sp. 399]|nr:hypothetical protein FRC17_000157 [Serendipita sp. 399]
MAKASETKSRQGLQNLTRRTVTRGTSKVSVRVIVNAADSTNRTDFDYRRSASGECWRMPVWYSSQCICDLGAPGKQLEFCQYKSCGICIPLTSAFTAFEFGQAVLRGNHGEGVYLTKDPTLADQFAISTTGSPFRVIILGSIILPSRPARKPDWHISDNGDVFVKNPLSITPDYLICYSK